MDLFDLFATITLDDSEYNSGVDRATSKGKNLARTLGNGLKKGAEIGMKALSYAATGITALTGFALKGFADYEQLAGGAQLMFGDAYDFVADKAKNAYKNVQMSQNEYLQQVNGFATGLKTALGGNEQAAAELADRIVTAEADIVAATGNTAENVQNAFNGIMKSNYTMLDNLQLGITPTKEGFQSLIDTVNAWNAENGRATDYQIDNVADAQSALLDYIEMQGMSGYAAKEAAGTISGSFAMVKASAKNLMTGLADDNADFGELIDNFVESVSTSAELILPRIEIALNGAGDLIEKLFPVIMDRIPEIITKTLPKLLESGKNILQSLIKGIQQNLPQIVSAVFMIIQTLADLLLSEGPALIEMGFNILIELMNGIANHPEEVINTIIQLIQTLLTTIFSNLPLLVQAGLNMVVALMQVLWDPATLKAIWEAGKGLIVQVINGIADCIPDIWNAGVSIVQSILDGIASVWDQLCDWFNGLWDGLFGNRSVDVGVNTTGNAPSGASSSFHGYTPPDGSHAGGLGYVPFDGYIAELHKGERVLTADENRSYNNSEKPITIIVQSVLDGKVIGESVIKYQRQKARAMG